MSRPPRFSPFRWLTIPELGAMEMADSPYDCYSSEMPPQRITERLILAPLQLSDADQAQRLFPRWEIVKYLNPRVPWPFPADGVLSFYRDVALPAVRRGDEWHWTLRLKNAPEELIGAISLHRSDQFNRGFWLGQPWQGKGLMTEAVCSINDFWFDELGFAVLRAPKAAENIRSRRISEKTGMRIVDTCEGEYVSGRLLTEIWEITAKEWHAKRQTLLRSSEDDRILRHRF